MYAQQSRARCHPRHSLVLLCVLVLSGGAEAAIGCKDCKAAKKALPERSAYWEAKLGLAALTEGPVVDVLLPAEPWPRRMWAFLPATWGRQRRWPAGATPSRHACRFWRPRPWFNAA